MNLSVVKRHLRFKFRNFSKYTNKLFSRDYFKIVFVLILISMINLYSVGSLRALISQIVIFISGTAAAIVISNQQFSFIKKISIPVYIFVCNLLFFVAAAGAKINGAKRWIRFFGFTLQPSELFKLAIILIIGFYLESRIRPDTKENKQYHFLDLVIPLTLTIVPLILILKQPDLGTAIICLIITGSILFFMGIEKKTLSFLIILISACGIIGWKHLKPYQKDRIIHFLNPEIDSRGKNWQSQQSLIAFGSGGIFGSGTKKGLEAQLGFLPERETDFALSSLAEEHGFISIAFVLCLINFLIIKLLNIARGARDRFSAVVAVGVAFWIGCQAIINTAMVMNLLPVVGVPFPIISYGGSSLFVILLAMGFISNIEHRKNLI